jgi:hypothetical protein
MEIFVKLSTRENPDIDDMKVKDILDMAKHVVETGLDHTLSDSCFKIEEVSAVPLR